MSTINDALIPASNQPTDDAHPITDDAAKSPSPAPTGSTTNTTSPSASDSTTSSVTGSTSSPTTDNASASTTGSTSSSAADTATGGTSRIADAATPTPSTHSTRASRNHRPDDAHSTGVGDMGRWSTRRIAMYALFVALAMAVSFIEFPLMPAAPWLKYDPSGVVCLVAGFAFGPSAAAIVSVLGFLPHLFTNPWGTLMSVLVALALSVPAAVIYRRRRTRASALVGILVGALLALAVAIGANLVITPMYAHMSMADVAKLIVPVLLPFNLIKFALNGVITFVVYKPVSTLLNRGQQ